MLSTLNLFFVLCLKQCQFLQILLNLKRLYLLKFKFLKEYGFKNINVINIL